MLCPFNLIFPCFILRVKGLLSAFYKKIQKKAFIGQEGRAFFNLNICIVFENAV